MIQPLSRDGFARLVGQIRELGSMGKLDATADGVKVSTPGGRYLTTLKKVDGVWKADVTFTE